MPNVFEEGRRKVIPAVLIYAKREGQVLMVHRNSGRVGDYHEGKWNGLGGKLEADESPLQAAMRELREESGLSLDETCFKSVGVIQFPNFKAHKQEDWMVFVFTAAVSETEQPWASGPEGELSWIAKDKILELNLWEGDRHFIPHVLEERPFVGTIWYEGQRVARHWLQTL